MSAVDELAAKQPGDNLTVTREIALVHFSEMNADLNSRSVIKGLINASETSLIVGAPQSGKTFFILDAALHIASKPAWRGLTIRNGSVVYVAAEAGRGIINRVAAWKLRHGYEPGDSIPFAATTCAIDLCHDVNGDTWRLAQAIQAAQQNQSLGPLSLIVIDTVSRAMAGGDENSPADMGAFVYSMDKLRDFFACHVAAVHHFGKDGNRGARGHSLLTANLDTIITTTTNGTGFYATLSKQREGKAGAVMPFKLDMVTLGHDGDNQPVTSCVVTHQTDESCASKKAQRKLSDTAKLGLQQLNNCASKYVTPLPASEYVPVGAKGVKLEVWREYLFKAGLINKDGGYREQFKRMNALLQAAV
jgi:hypothetical protein